VSYLIGTITFQLSQTSNGKPKVLILADDPYAITVELGSIKTPPVYSTAQATKPPTIVEQTNLDIEPPAQPITAPICANHHIPMKLMHGKRGPFYSCHEKMPDGSWCKFRPVASPA
jgi:hypothetical protein